MRMNLRQLHYICTVAECRSISKAAKQLMISQPSLSNFLAKTEQALGVRLFERSNTAPLTLTYAGERFIEYAQRILLDSNSMLRELSDISGNIAGRIRLGFPHERLSYMVPIILPKYREQYPDIELKFTTGNGTYLLSQLRAGSIDIAVLPYRQPDAILDATDLFDEAIYLVAPKDLLAQRGLYGGGGANVDPTKIGLLDFILLREGHLMRSFVDDFFAEAGITPNIVLETSSNLASYKLSTTGLGVTIVPETTINLARDEPLAEKFPLSTWTVRAFYRKSAYIGEPEKALIEVIKQAF